MASEASAQALGQRFGCPVHTEPSACLAVSELLLALKPQQLDGLVEQLGGRTTIAAAAANRAEPPLLISVLAGVSSMPPSPQLIAPLAHVYALLEGDHSYSDGNDKLAGGHSHNDCNDK